MLKPILWKEWREQRWKLAFGTIMLASFTAALLLSRVTSSREAVIGVSILGSLMLGLYNATGVFAPERTGGTLTFLNAKPVARWTVFLCKWFFGWLNLVVPILAVGLVASVIRAGEPFSSNNSAMTLSYGLIGSIAFSTVYYTMICCFSPRKAGEAYVGLVGVLILLAICIHGFTMGAVCTGLGRTSLPFFAKLFAFINPTFWLASMDPGGTKDIPFLAVTQSIIFVLVLWIGLRKWQRSV